MTGSPRIPVIVWHVMRRLNRRMLSNYGQKSRAAGRVLVLTTQGRRSGKARATPLQYEEVDGVYYVASARGVQSDWYRNLLACPVVQIQVGSRQFSALATPITDVTRIADFLELRLQRHPHFMGLMLRMEGLPRRFTRVDLEKLAGRLAIVALVPG